MSDRRPRISRRVLSVVGVAAVLSSLSVAAAIAGLTEETSTKVIPAANFQSVTARCTGDRHVGFGGAFVVQFADAVLARKEVGFLLFIHRALPRWQTPAERQAVSRSCIMRLSHECDRK